MFLIGSLLSLICILVALVYHGISPLEFINLPIFLILFFPVFFIGFLTHPKEFGNALQSLLKDDTYNKKQREVHSSIFEVMSKVSYGVGWISFIILMISNLKEGTEPILVDRIIRSGLKSFYPIFYGLFMHYIIFYPASIKVKLNKDKL
jgi:flagellar motor component MotA